MFTYFLPIFLLINKTSPNWPIIIVMPFIQNWRGYLVLMVLYVFIPQFTFLYNCILPVNIIKRTIFILNHILKCYTSFRCLTYTKEINNYTFILMQIPVLHKNVSLFYCTVLTKCLSYSSIIIRGLLIINWLLWKGGSIL